MNIADSPQTLGEALHAASALLARSSPSARLDAELLLEYVTGLSRTSFHATPERVLPASAGWSFQQLIKRRLKGEPVAYIRGQQAFWSLLLEVSPAVLIPRPETELVVERALAHLPPDSSGQIVDLGTGSGAIALALASERPTARVIGVDVSRKALDIAFRNAGRLQIGNVRFVQGSWFAPLAGERFALLTANPPYVAQDDPELAANVRRFEPELALIPGRTGMEALEQIIAQAPRHLTSGGWLILEHGWQQASAVRDRLVRGGFTHVRSYTDLAGHERVTEGLIEGLAAA
ncbi:release factor glutamine methyltransferase [Steroidobacter denitrificans]|uniref:Release factor glutamine methyltransferase n=1 Tax=Steroidobacter denitrificans TaxID=465721 RepID=A0A127F6E7_STEDE|nr:peptide chain release factor N(5)-glutamine methyltransferase [Steroidobacter denitrificans]AMN45994.1 release factor glutamine methyltransferase [Steroidobacter denitrificans]